MQLYICEKPSQAAEYAKVLNIPMKNKSQGFFSNGKTSITWGYGHLLEMYQPGEYDERYKKWRLEDLPIIPQNWRLRPKKEAAKQYKVVKDLINKASEVVIATDADREGELIAVSLLEQNNFKGTRKRVWTGALDAKTLKKAIDNMKDGSSTHDLYLAGLARQRLDWLMGLNLTRGMTVANNGKVEGPMPTGRVQTPTLNLVYMRDLEIENFKPKDYFELSCLFSNDNGKFEAQWQIPEKYLDEEEKKYCLDKNIVDEVAKKIDQKDGKITTSKKVRKNEKHPLLHSLSSLQKEASSKYGFSAKQTLDLAQSLYEKYKATTYPRTDSQHMNVEQFHEAKEILDAVKKTDKNSNEISKLIDEADTSIKSQAWNDKKVSAHHAIVPTGTPSDIEKMDDKEKKIYDLIRRKYIAQFYPLAESDTTTIIVECEGETFKATGTVPVIQGWKVVFPDKKSSTEELPSMNEGETVLAEKPKVQSKKTQPPARYTEGTLIDAMKSPGKFVSDERLKKVLKDVKGIGTEATRGNIIANLIAYNYLEVRKKQIVSTPKGRTLIKLVPELAKSIETTAYWETELEKIAEGNNTVESMVTSQVKGLKEMIQNIKDGKCTAQETVGMKYQCPNCDSGLKRLKSKKSGKHFWVCMDRENCNTILPDNRGKPGKPPEKVDQGDKEYFCEDCKEKLIRKKGQYGIYWQCSGKECRKIYKDKEGVPVDKNTPDIEQGDKEFFCPKDNTKLIRKKGKFGLYWNCSKCSQNYKEDEKTQSPILQKKEKPTSDYTCPNCKKGKLVERKGPKGVFWGCNNFPKCKTIVSDNGGKPEGF